MALFVVSYDLVKRKDYQPLWDELDRLGGQKVLLSMYLLNLSNSAQDVLDHLTSFVDDDDRIMVIEFVGRPKYKRALKGAGDWLSRNT